MAIKRGVYGDIGVGGYQTLEELARLLSNYIEDIFATTEFVMNNFEPKGLVIAHINTDDAHPQYRRLDVEVPIEDLEGPVAEETGLVNFDEVETVIASEWFPRPASVAIFDETIGTGAYVSRQTGGTILARNNSGGTLIVTGYVPNLFYVYVSYEDVAGFPEDVVTVTVHSLETHEGGSWPYTSVGEASVTMQDGDFLEIPVPTRTDINFPFEIDHITVLTKKHSGKGIRVHHITSEPLSGGGSPFNRFIREDKTWAYVTKEDVDLGNVDNVQQATKFEFDTHNSDSVRHITSLERSEWSAKETPEGAQAKVDTHAADNVKHTSEAERSDWNSKETPAGAQAKADAVQSNLDSHVADIDSHVTSADKSNWDSKETTTGSQAKVNAHANNEEIHVTKEDKSRWDNAELSVFQTNYQLGTSAYVDWDQLIDRTMHNVNPHLSNETIHVTQADKDKWNTAAESGGGLELFEESRHDTGPNLTTPTHVFNPIGENVNINLAISPKGNGAIIANVPDSTLTGGNRRGLKAVDLQQLRDNIDQVASGYFSTISGGLNNKASGHNSVVIGGNRNEATGEYSVVLGGVNGTARGTYGKMVFASGGFSSSAGTAQIGYNVLRGETNPSVPIKTLSANGGVTSSTQYFPTLPASSLYYIIAKVVARSTTSNTIAKVWELKCAAHRSSSNNQEIAFVGDVIKTIIAESEGASVVDCDLVLNTTRSSVDVVATGDESSIVRWVCKFETVEVG